MQWQARRLGPKPPPPRALPIPSLGPFRGRQLLFDEIEDQPHRPHQGDAHAARLGSGVGGGGGPAVMQNMETLVNSLGLKLRSPTPRVYAPHTHDDPYPHPYPHPRTPSRMKVMKKLACCAADTPNRLMMMEGLSMMAWIWDRADPTTKE
jgi:hypothetical protein